MNSRIRKQRIIDNIELACIIIAAGAGTIFLSTLLTTLALEFFR